MQNVRFALRPVQRARAWAAVAERGSAGNAALWRADLTRTGQEDHCHRAVHNSTLWDPDRAAITVSDLRRDLEALFSP